MRHQFIGTMAAELGVNPRTLRYYESLGLLPPPKRSASGYRLYDGQTGQRLRFISKDKGLGLSLREIHDILKVWESGKRPCPSVRRVVQGHVRRINQQLRELHALKNHLADLLDDWRENGNRNGTVCPKIEGHKAKGRRYR